MKKMKTPIMLNPNNKFVVGRIDFDEPRKLNIELPTRGNIRIGKFFLENTCEFAPEQYDVSFEGNVVAYIRQSSGKVLAILTSDSEIVYSANTEGYVGFMDNERLLFLKEAIEQIENHLIWRKEK